MPLSLLIAIGLLGIYLMLRARSQEAAARLADPDQVTLNELRRAGSSLDRVHEVEFFLYLPDREQAAAVRDQLEGEGFQVELRADGAGADWLCVATRALTPTLSELRRLRSHFTEVAESRNGAYDGWGTTVVSPEDG